MELSHFTLVLTDHHTLGEKGGRDVELSHFTLVVTDHHTLGEKGRRDVELSSSDTCDKQSLTCENTADNKVKEGKLYPYIRLRGCVTGGRLVGPGRPGWRGDGKV